MSGLTEFLKIVVVPALFALALYFATTTYILPYYRAHKAQYASYIPLPRTGALSADSIASTSQTLRERVSAGLIAFVLPRRTEAVGAERTYAIAGSEDGSEDEEWDLEAGSAEGIRDLTAGRRAEMVREIEEMENAERSVRGT